MVSTTERPSGKNFTSRTFKRIYWFFTPGGGKQRHQASRVTHVPRACSHSQQSLWGHRRCTFQTAWFPFPWSGESSDGILAQTHAVGRGWWGRPWCTQRWALLGLGCEGQDKACSETGHSHSDFRAIRNAREHLVDTEFTVGSYF